MRRIKSPTLIASALLALAASVSSSRAVAAPPKFISEDGMVPQSVMIRTNERSLANMEQLQSKIEVVKDHAARMALSGIYEQQQLDYATGIVRQHDAVMAAIRGYGRPIHIQRFERALGDLKAFQDLAQRHEIRTIQLSTRAKAIVRGAGFCR